MAGPSLDPVRHEDFHRPHHAREVDVEHPGFVGQVGQVQGRSNPRTVDTRVKALFFAPETLKQLRKSRRRHVVHLVPCTAPARRGRAFRYADDPISTVEERLRDGRTDTVRVADDQICFTAVHDLPSTADFLHWRWGPTPSAN